MAGLLAVKCWNDVHGERRSRPPTKTLNTPTINLPIKGVSLFSGPSYLHYLNQIWYISLEQKNTFYYVCLPFGGCRCWCLNNVKKNPSKNFEPEITASGQRDHSHCCHRLAPHTSCVRSEDKDNFKQFASEAVQPPRREIMQDVDPWNTGRGFCESMITALYFKTSGIVLWVFNMSVLLWTSATDDAALTTDSTTDSTSQQKSMI